MRISLESLEFVRRVLFVVPILIVTGVITSCDKVVEVGDKITDLIKGKKADEEAEAETEEEQEDEFRSFDTTVSVVGEKRGKQIIAMEERLVIVGFYSDSSGPCRRVAPVLVRLAKNNPYKVKIIKADVRRSEEWAQKERITSIPAFKFYVAGRVKNQFSGAPPEKDLQVMIDTYAPQINIRKPRKVDPNVPIQPMPKDWLPPGVTKGTPET